MHPLAVPTASRKMVILKFYKNPGLKPSQLKSKLDNLVKISSAITKVNAELCYYIEAKSDLSKKEIDSLKWILSSPFEPDQLVQFSAFKNDDFVVEIGPR